MITTLHVDGMTCGHCVQTVSRALSAVPGVERALVTLVSGLAEVEGDATGDALVAAVEASGYHARVA